MPPITPHGTKKYNECLATKTLDHFTDIRRAFGVIRITVESDTCRAKYSARRQATRRDGNGDGRSPSSSGLAYTDSREAEARYRRRTVASSSTPSRRSAGPPRAESVAVRPIQAQRRDRIS
ncbi:hypothetical protein E4U58_001189 [Claviceps cyperi]|nr:hypothetical protein E4U58_001189 [Claviceps cyperi]